MDGIDGKEDYDEPIDESRLPVKGPKKEVETGVRINLISRRKLDSMSSDEKLRFILDEVKRGSVLVLERGLTAVEEIDLIKSTMSEIDQETFIGIEMQSYSSDDVKAGSWFSKLLGRTNVPRMSVIGPASLLKTIQKDGNMIQAMILTGKSIIKESTEDERSTEPELAGDEFEASEERTDQDRTGEDPYGDNVGTNSETGSEAPLAIPVSDIENEDTEENSSEQRSEPEYELDPEPETKSDNYKERTLEQYTLYEDIFGTPTSIIDRVDSESIQISDTQILDNSDMKILPKLSELPNDIEFKNKNNIQFESDNNNNDITNEGSTFLYKRLKNYYEE